MTSEQKKIPIWFSTATIILLIWNLMGIVNFFQHLTITDEAILAMPENQRELYSNFPLWTIFAFALAVFGGSCGSLALLFKMKIAHPIFIASLIGIVVQMSHSLKIASGMGDDGAWVILMTVLLIMVGVFAIWLSKYSITKNWIK